MKPKRKQPKIRKARSLSRLVPPEALSEPKPWFWAFLDSKTMVIILGAGLILGALAVRLYHVGVIPTSLICDEADNFLNILSVQLQGRPGWFDFDWKPSPAFSVNLMALLAGWLGPSVTSLRLPSILLSTAAIVPFYFLARRFADRPAAWAASAGLAFNFVFLHFSRSGWENVHVCLYSAMAFLGAAWILEGRTRLGGLLCGAGCGLGLLGYFSGRLILPMVWLCLLSRLPESDSESRLRILKGLAGATLVAAVMFLPMMPEVLRHWDYFNLRAQNVWLLGASFPNETFRSAAEAMFKQFFWGLGMFFWGTVKNPKYAPTGHPLLDVLSILVVLAGMGVSFTKIRSSYFVWIFFLVPLLVTQILTTRSPDPARGLSMLIPVFIFFAMGAEWLLSFLKNRPELQAALLPGVLACIILYNVIFYFHWIQNPETLYRRYPAIAIQDVPRWISFQKKQLRSGRRGVNVVEWNRMRTGR